MEVTASEDVEDMCVSDSVSADAVVPKDVCCSEPLVVDASAEPSDEASVV